VIIIDIGDQVIKFLLGIFEQLAVLVVSRTRQWFEQIGELGECDKVASTVGGC